MKRFLGVVLIASLAISLGSCAQTGASRSSTSRGQKKEIYNQKITEARILHEQGEVDGAISVLQTWVDTAQYEPAHDLGYELIVEWLLQLNRREEAKRTASFFLSRHPKSPSAANLIKLFDQHASPASTSPSNESHETTPIEPEILQDKEGGANPMDTVLDKEKSADKNYILFEIPVSTALATVAKNGPHLAQAHARLAMHYFHLGDLSESSKHLSLATGLSADVSKDLDALKQEIASISEVDMKSIGLLLPLSGSFAPFGKKTLTAMGLAWAMPLVANAGINTVTKDGIRIVIADSKGDARETQKVLDQLVKVHKVALVVGDITNDPSLLAAERCQQYGVPMLSLSRHPSVSQLGEYVFMVNASQQQQISKLVDHAMNSEGHKNFAILFPKHNYGMALSRMFYDEVKKRGGNVTGIESYDVHETSFFTPVKKLVGKFYLSLRPDADECNSLGTQAEKCRNSIKPMVDFDALFIPEFQKLSLVIPALLQEDMLITKNARAKSSLALATKNENPSYVQLLGTSSWNDKAVLDKIAAHVDGAVFVDAFSFDDSDELKQFAINFTSAFGQAPSTLEVFAHDAASLAFKLVAAQEAAASRKELRDRIAAFKGKIGLLSQFAFLSSGELDAPEAGFRITNGAVEKVVKPGA